MVSGSDISGRAKSRNATEGAYENKTRSICIVDILCPGDKRSVIRGLSVMAEDDDAGNRAWSANVVCQAQLRVLHLPFTTLSLQLFDALVNHPDPARPDRVAK